jgi:hypothetical protein
MSAITARGFYHEGDWARITFPDSIIEGRITETDDSGLTLYENYPPKPIQLTWKQLGDLPTHHLQKSTTR